MLKTKMKNKKIMDEKLYSPYAKQEQTEEAIEYFRNVQRASYGLKTMKSKPTVKEKKKSIKEIFYCGKGVEIEVKSYPLQGWECPNCHRVWSPYRASCDCVNNLI